MQNRWAAAALLWCLTPAAALGGGFDSGSAGTTGAAFLRMGTGARADAMGGAFSAAADDASAAWWNPAALTRLEGASILMSHAGSQDAVNMENVSFGMKAGRLAFGGAATYVDAGEIERTDAAGSSLGGYRPRDCSLSVSLASDLSFLNAPALAAGLSAKAFKSKIVEQADGRALDAGLLARLWSGDESALRASLVAQNLGGSIKFDRQSDPLPTTLRLGLALQAGPRRLLAAEAYVTRGGGVQAAVGAEAGTEVVSGVRAALRAGFNTMTMTDVSLISALSAGGGIAFGKFSVDYAAGMLGQAQQVHRLTFGLRLGAGAADGRRASRWSAREKLWRSQEETRLWLQ